jgi:hypothetical protein
MALLHGIEIQKDFPSADISDSTAEVLELLLLNRELIGSFHTSAEFINFLYRFGHRTLDLTANPHLDDMARLEAFSFGIESFEAIAALVRPVLGEEYPDDETATRQVMSVHLALDNDFATTLVDAKDRLKQELPKTTHVIGQSALRFCGRNTDYALSGAAIAREVEVLSLAG